MRQLKIATLITQRDSESIDMYLHEIGKITMLTADEEVTLARAIRTGDQKALKRLVEANLRFVVSVAKQYQHQGMNLSDLINEGNIGLIKAATRFDETKGFKFISYAVWWIRQSILSAIQEQGRLIRMPQHKGGHYSKVQKAIISLSQSEEREPTAEEISSVTHLSLKEVDLFINEGMKRPISMDSPLQDGDDLCVGDSIAETTFGGPDTDLLVASVKTDLLQWLQILPERDATIVKQFFGIEGPARSLEEIANSMSLTRERVRQLKEKALKKMRRCSFAKQYQYHLAS
jgi:RNA polymerase primary sigma factor